MDKLEHLSVSRPWRIRPYSPAPDSGRETSQPPENHGCGSVQTAMQRLMIAAIGARHSQAQDLLHRYSACGILLARMSSHVPAHEFASNRTLSQLCRFLPFTEPSHKPKFKSIRKNHHHPGKLEPLYFICLLLSQPQKPLSKKDPQCLLSVLTLRLITGWETIN